MAPKGDGRLIVGATVEERGFDDAVTAGGVYALLEGARRAFPAIEEMAVEAIWTGFRPSSIDDAPILGSTAGRRARDRHRPSSQRLSVGAGDGVCDRGADRRRQRCRRWRRRSGSIDLPSPSTGAANRSMPKRECPHEAHHQRKRTRLRGGDDARRTLARRDRGARDRRAARLCDLAQRRGGAPCRLARLRRCATATPSRSSAPCREDDGAMIATRYGARGRP